MQRGCRLPQAHKPVIIALHKMQFASAGPNGVALSFAECGDPVSEPRHLTAGGVAVHDIFLRRANDHRLGLRHRGEGGGPIAGADRLFNFAHCTSQARTPRFIDDGAADALARGFLG